MNKKNFLLLGFLLFCGAISAAPVDEELAVVMLTQCLPFASPVYRDLMHRLVHAAILD